MTRKTVITEEIRVHMLQRYAMFERPRDVMASVRDTFGVELTKEQVRNYNLDCGRAAKRFSAKSKAIFELTRSQFLEGITQHPVAHKAFRIKRLGIMAEAAEDKKNYALAAKLLEQAAKEVGGAFTNEVNVRGRVNHNHAGTVEHVAVSIEEKRNILEDRLREAMLRLPDPKTAPTVN